ncbi:MFS transporter [Luteolibacter ambystomatis]|uniref:MFS transporter n=1 Tax=Luteolibacter ambystomatis TaxID=2824561 RepID=UPI00362E2636
MASGPRGTLQPLDFDADGNGRVSSDGIPGKAEIDAIRGRNTWILWGAGNETFWGWLQEQGYGLNDFLILMDGRRRDTRFHDAGLINQPGFRKNDGHREKRVLGLYLDVPDPGGTKLTVPVLDPHTRQVVGSKAIGAYSTDYPGVETRLPFEPGQDKQAQAMLKEVEEWLASADDGVNPLVYGYPSGIVGLRLMLNPDFFGNTVEAKEAREYWDRRVITQQPSDYYEDSTVHADPRLVRPFRPSMSCGFCHVGPHPLNPPADPENPGWENLSSIVGNQYWRPQEAFGNLLDKGAFKDKSHFLYHFLKSQPPGTIDTSLVSTDHINNPNTINAIFDVPARFARAAANTTERQSAANLLIPSIEDVPGADRRHFPRVLLDGSDSCGGFAAFIRVPLNIGTYSEEWAKCHNPIVGYRPQMPFRVSSSQRNSVFWQVNERYRVPYLAAFFTFKTSARSLKGGGMLPAQNATAAMKLYDAKATVGAGAAASPDDGKAGAQDVGRRELEKNSDLDRLRGRRVFLKNCAICHSSKQPGDFRLSFETTEPEGGWKGYTVGAQAPAHYKLPMSFQSWSDFKASPAYADYVRRITEIASRGMTADQVRAGFKLGVEDDPFLVDNFMSSEIRIPITLVGTNSARAVATNAMAGHVWDNFSSEDYKHLPAVGKVTVFDPCNEAHGFRSYAPPSGGPGYYRPPTLLSLWSTAPYLHNNTVGGFYPTRDPAKVSNPTTVEARLDAFGDGIRKILWKDKRPLESVVEGVTFEPRPGDLRGRAKSAAADPGYIYRLPTESYIVFQAPFIRPLVEGVTGPVWFGVVSIWLWVLLLAVWVVAFFYGKSRHVGVLLIVMALMSAAFLLLTGIGQMTGTAVGALVVAATGLLEMPAWVLWCAVGVLALLGVVFLYFRPNARVLAIFFIVVMVAALVGVVVLQIRKGGAGASHGWLVGAAMLLLVVFATSLFLIRKRDDRAVKAVFAALACLTALIAVVLNGYIAGRFGPIRVGPIPEGTPVNLLMNLDPEKGPATARGVVAMVRASQEIRKRNLKGDEACMLFERLAGEPLMEASRCPDFVLDRGHLFGEVLDPDPLKNNQAKEDLISFLKTL